MEMTRRYLPMEWEERWRKEKEQRKRVMEEGGEKVEEVNRKLNWIMAYNNQRMGLNMNQAENTEVRGNHEQMRGPKEERKEGEMIKEERVHLYYRDVYPREVFEALKELRESCLLNDLTLSTVDGHSFHTHSLVMAASSSLIRETLYERSKGRERSEPSHVGGNEDGGHNMKTQNKMSIQIDPEVGCVGLAGVVEFVYTGTIAALNTDTVAQIRAAAQALGIPGTLDLCKEEEEQLKKGGNTRGKEKMTSATDQMKINLQAIRQLWKDQVGCDVELEAEGSLFFAHRVLLAASVDYFRGMFTSGMRESRQPYVALQSLGAFELEALLHFSYTGELPLSWGNVFEIACAAIQLQFQPVLSLCLDFLRHEMDASSCLDVASFTEAYGLDELREVAGDFVLRHFQEVALTPKFLDLEAEKLLEVIQSDAICIPSELAVFRAVFSWVEADREARMSQAREMMTAVRFNLMTFKEFREVRAVNLLMECSDGNDVELYGSALREFGFSESGDKRRVRRPKDALVLVGGDQLDSDEGRRLPSRQLWFANSLRSGIGLVKEIEWRMLGEMPEKPRFRHGLAVMEGKLYVAGGCDFYAMTNTLKSAYRYDPFEDSWQRLADMREERSNFAVAVQENHICILGGDKDIHTNLDSVEVYCPESDSWSLARPLDEPLSGHAATIWKGKIFISGGFNSKYQCLASAFLYHPERGTTYLAEMSQDRALHCMEALADRLFVAGGVCNLRTFFTDQLVCESYDPKSDGWGTIAPLPLPHVGAASAILEDKLYVLGGYCQEDYSESKLVHRYDSALRRWENMGRMPGPNTDIRACLLRLPTHLRK